MKTLVESVSHYAYRRRSRFFVLEASCLSEPLTRVRLIAMKLSRPCLLLVCVVMAALGQPGPPGPGEGPSPPPVALTPGAGPNAANNLAQAIWLYLQGGSSAGGPPGAASGLPPPAPFGPVAPHGAVASTSGGLPPPAPVGSAPGASGSTEGPPWRRSHSRVPAPPVAAEVEATPAVETAAPSGTVVEVPDNTTGPTPKAASKRPLTLDLRHCRVCQETAYQGKGICLNTDCVPWYAEYNFVLGGNRVVVESFFQRF